MERVGIFELKTHLSEFVHRVQNGEEFFITNRGETVAKLSPTPKKKSKKNKEAEFFTKLNELQKTLKGVKLYDDLDDLKSTIEEGRR